MAQNNIKIKFNVQGLDEVRKLSKVDDLLFAHDDFRNYLLNYRKHADMSKAQLKTFTEVFDAYFSILDDRAIDLEDLSK